MFVKPPEGLKDCFGFVHDHESFNFGIAEGDWGEGTSRYMGTILVSKKTKLRVERIIGQILNLKKIELPINNKFGLIIENVIAGIHHGHINLGDSVNDEVLRRILIDLEDLPEKESCPDFCRCKFQDKERRWGHHLYHLLLKYCAKEIGISYGNLVSDYTNYKRITIQKVSEYLSKNDWDIKEGIAEEEGAVGFILISFLQNYRESFRVGNINHLEEEILIDKNPFDDCMNGECKYNDPYTIWESESIIQTPDPNRRMFPRRIDARQLVQSHGVHLLSGKTSPFKSASEKMLEAPRATISQNGCICSVSEYYFGLYINKFVENKDGIKVDNECIKDSRDETQLSDNEKIDVLVAKFYSHFLPKKQAKLAAKIIKRQYYDSDKQKPLDDKERHSKFLLRKKLENIVSYGPDIKHLSEQISKTKGVKNKGGDNDG